MSAGGWHLTDNELACDMTLKDVSMSNIGEVTKSHKCSCLAIICAQCAVVIICSTVVQLGDSFTVAFPPSGQGQSNCKGPTQSCSNRPLCRTFQSNGH